MADAVAVLDAFELERPAVIGNSWGGFLALALVAAHPERVRAVVSLDGLGVTGDGGLGRVRRGDRRPMSPPTRLVLAFEARAVRGEASDEEATEAVKIAWRMMFADPDAARAARPAPSAEAYGAARPTRRPSSRPARCPSSSPAARSRRCSCPAS